MAKSRLKAGWPSLSAAGRGRVTSPKARGLSSPSRWREALLSEGAVRKADLGCPAGAARPNCRMSRLEDVGRAMSEGCGYASRLAKVFSYVNTYHRKEGRGLAGRLTGALAYAKHERLRARFGLT